MKINAKNFQDPPLEYRGAPFWAWTDKLEQTELETQIDELKKMGFGGFNMHARQGLKTPYLSEEFMQAVQICVQKSETTGMQAWIYDEDRWPSGFAGGKATVNPYFRKKALVFSKERKEEVFSKLSFSKYALCGRCDEGENLVDKDILNNGETYLLAAFRVDLDECGFLNSYNLVLPEENPQGDIWYAYVITFPPLVGLHGTNQVDYLMDEAIAEFIKITYQAYYDRFGSKFGKTIPAVFTDEPQVTQKINKKNALDESEAVLTWTTDFYLTFKQTYGYDLVERLPELIWDAKTPSYVRLNYFEHQTFRFKKAYAEQISTWCKNHNIKFSGHYAQEDTLQSQAEFLGDIIPLYDPLDIAGIDVLCNRRLFTTALQCRSAVRRGNKKQMLSECYGVTGWDFDFKGHKYQGDWQAALGVNVRVPHLSWYSMRGDGKFDYPAAISYQSCWWDKYKYVEDHYARLNVVNEGTKPIVKVGVIHPIESYELFFGAESTSREKRNAIQKNFENVSEWLLTGNIDFDYLSEYNMEKEYVEKEEPTLTLGACEYQAIVVPELDTIRSSTLKILNKFASNGGKIIVLGKKPSYIDGKISSESGLLDEIKITPFTRYDLLCALESERSVSITDGQGLLTYDYVYSLNSGEGYLALFVAPLDYPFENEPVLPSAVKAKKRVVNIKGNYDVTLYDTVNGNVLPLNRSFAKGVTSVVFNLYACDSLTLVLTEHTDETKEEKIKTEEKKLSEKIAFDGECEYLLDEDNVFILDFAEWQTDGAFNKKEEIIKINEILRSKFGFPPTLDGKPQPYACSKDEKAADVVLKFKIHSEIETEVKIAYEYAESATLNGKSVCLKECGYFVDRHIILSKLGKLKAGENELTVTVPFGENVMLQNLFLTGNFGVDICGEKTVIVKAKDKISFGSLKEQGLGFYGGKITYLLPFECNGGELKVKAERWKGTTLGVKLTGGEEKIIAYPPYKASLGNIPSGKHTLEVTLYPSRNNCFGAMHNHAKIRYMNDSSWLAEGYAYAKSYNLTDFGLFKSPEIEIYE